MFQRAIRCIGKDSIFQIERVGMHDEQISTAGVRDTMREWQRCQVINTLLSNLLSCPANGGALLGPFFWRCCNHFDIHIALNDRAVQSLHQLQYFSWAWAIKTEIARDGQVIYHRMLRKVVQHFFHCDLITVYILYDSNTHMISYRPSILSICAPRLRSFTSRCS